MKLVRTEGRAGLPQREIAGPPRRDMAGLPAVESLPRFETPYPPMPYSELTDVRLIDHRTEHGMPRTRAWVRLDDSADAVAELTPAGHAAVLLDVVPPGPFFGDPEVAFVPTVDFAMHRAPGTGAGGWHLAEGVTEWWTGVSARNRACSGPPTDASSRGAPKPAGCCATQVERSRG